MKDINDVFRLICAIDNDKTYLQESIYMTIGHHILL